MCILHLVSLHFFMQLALRHNTAVVVAISISVIIAVVALALCASILAA
jgi:hypothetical protein